MRIGTAGDNFGDALLSLAFFQKLLGQGGVIHFGSNPQIVRLLEVQPFIEKVFSMPDLYWPRRMAAWEDEGPPYGAQTARGRQQFQSLMQARLGAEHTYLRTHLLGEHMLSHPLWAQGLVLPEESLLEAARLRAEINAPRVVLLHPYSFASETFENHYPHWPEVIDLLGASLPLPIVLTGADWNEAATACCRQRLGSHWFDFVDRTTTNMTLFGLTRQAALTVTTSNSVAHWCACDNRPHIVVANRRCSDPDYYCTKNLQHPSATVFTAAADPEVVTATILARLESLYDLNEL